MINVPSYNTFVAITTSDSANIVGPKPVTDGILVGTSSSQDIVGVQQNGTTITLKNVIAGNVYPIRVKRINATNTTASNLVACYLV
jgi:hypothetical protein